MTGVRFSLVAILGLMVALLTGSPVRAETPVFSEAQKTEIEKLVHDYLVKHPEVLVEAANALHEQQDQAEAEDRRKALRENHAALFDDAETPVIGNPKGDVTVVEFFDYACPYCKSVDGSLRALLKEDGNIRLVLKEFPVLGPGSVVASEAALAARAQGKYEPFHDALLATRGQLSEEVVLNVARSVGLDVDRLKADMAKPDITSILKAAHELAESLAIRGTPAFVVGDEVYPGALDLPTLKRMVEQARKG